MATAAKKNDESEPARGLKNLFYYSIDSENPVARVRNAPATGLFV